MKGGKATSSSAAFTKWWGSGKEKKEKGISREKRSVYTVLLFFCLVARYGLKSCKCTAQVDTRMIEIFFPGSVRDRLIFNRNIFAIKHLAHLFVDPHRGPECTKRVPQRLDLFARNNPNELREKLCAGVG